MVARPQESFSRWRRFRILLNVIVVIFAALAIVITLNYLSRDYYRRLQLSTRTKIELSPRTLHLLQTITNQVKVIIYYDKKEPFYTTVSDLLNQYSLLNPKISIQTVDYARDAGAAQKVKTDYKLNSPTDKNIVIFDCEGRTFGVDGNALTHFEMEPVPSEEKREFRRKPTAFEGETRFSAALLVVTSPKPLTACYLQGHREHPPEGGGDFGYDKFLSVLQHQNSIRAHSLSLLGTNEVSPEHCNLLIIAGPHDELQPLELDKLDKYLAQGGHMLVLFNASSINKETGGERTGLDKILAKWGVQVGTQYIQDPDRWSKGKEFDLVVADFNQKHPLVNTLLGSALYLAVPRSIGKLKGGTPAASAPRVEEIAFTGPRAIVAGSTGPGQTFPLMVTVETSVQGVVTEQGAMRLVVAGDSFFLANAWIDSAGNRDFADAAINWLLNRAQLLEGIGPRPIKESKVTMTHSQFQKAQWILLAGLPGGVLILGGAVWLRRRK